MKTVIKTIKVSEKGQIAIPKEVREAIGIETGDDLILIQKGKNILLEKSEIFEERIQDEFKGFEKLTEISLKKLWDNEEDEIWNSYLKNKR